jgi:hypothetical protein
MYLYSVQVRVCCGINTDLYKNCGVLLLERLSYIHASIFSWIVYIDTSWSYLPVMTATVCGLHEPFILQTQKITVEVGMAILAIHEDTRQ